MGGVGRNNSSLAKEFNSEFDKGQTLGNSIDRVRLNGYNTECVFNQNIRQDIKNHYKQQCCAMCGVRGNSENTQIEVDHIKTAARMIQEFLIQTHRLLMIFRLCVKLVMTRNARFVKNAKKVAIDLMQQKFLAIIILSMKGEAEYDGCVGCYQYDPIQYRKTCNDRIYNEGYQKGYYEGYQIGYHQKTTL